MNSLGIDRNSAYPLASPTLVQYFLSLVWSGKQDGIEDHLMLSVLYTVASRPADPMLEVIINGRPRIAE